MQIRRLHAQCAQCLLYLKGKPLKCIPQSRIFLLPGSSLCDKFVCQYANIKYCFRILEEQSICQAWAHLLVKLLLNIDSEFPNACCSICERRWSHRRRKKHWKWKPKILKCLMKQNASNEYLRQSFSPCMHISFGEGWNCKSTHITGNRRNIKREGKILQTWMNNWKTNMTHFQKYQAT